MTGQGAQQREYFADAGDQRCPQVVRGERLDGTGSGGSGAHEIGEAVTPVA